MKKRPTPVKPASKQAITLWRQFRAKHRRLSTFLIVILLVATLVGSMKYNSYLHKFSDEDYATLEATARDIFLKVGGGDTQKYEQCHYAAPEKYASVRLYCGVQMATYLAYENEEQAIAVAENLEREVKKRGSVISYIPELYKNPSDAFTWLTVTFKKPLPAEQCNFTIATGERAGGVASYLRKETKDGERLIGIAFDCGAESREEYFPVTYRQG